MCLFIVCVYLQNKYWTFCLYFNGSQQVTGPQFIAFWLLSLITKYDLGKQSKWPAHL